MHSARAQLVYASDRVTAPLDLISARIEGAYIETTRSYPTYYHGNRLVLDRAPDAHEMTDWIARYHQNFAWRSVAAPAIITWYSEDEVPLTLGPMDALVETQIALSAAAGVKRVDPPADVRFIEICDGAGWEDLADLESAAHPEYGAFNRWRVASLRALVEAGYGGHYALRDPAGTMVAAAGGYLREGYRPLRECGDSECLSQTRLRSLSRGIHTRDTSQACLRSDHRR